MRTAIASAGVLALLLTGSSLAATRVATDSFGGVEFRLDGHLLTATIKPQPIRDPSDFGDDLMGRKVTAACGTRLAARRGVSTHRTRRWPADRLFLKFWLPRDVSARVRWCVLETGASGGDVAAVVFKRRN